VAAPPLDSPCDGPVTYPGGTKILVKSSKGRNGQTPKQYQKKWLQHIQRMDTTRLPKQALQYKPKRTKEHRTTEEEMEGPTSS